MPRSLAPALVAALALPLLPTSTGLAHAAVVDVPSIPSEIVVHTDGARITRVLAVEVPAGSATIALRGLPAGLDPASVRVTGEGSSGLAIAAVDTKLVPGDATPVVDADLERRLEALRADRASLAGAIDAADVQRAAVLRYAQASPEKLGADGKPLDVERWTDAWRTLGRGLGDINEQLRLLRDRARKLDDEIVALERARPAPPRSGAPKRDILVAVDAAASFRGTVTVSYQVAGARWTPLYDARLVTTGDKPKLELVRRAVVEQRTGENWTGARLTLSTAPLRRGTAAPDLPTQVLTLVDPMADADNLPRPSASLRAARPGVEEKAASFAAPSPAAPAALAPPPVVATPVLATIETGAFEATFAIPGAVDIPQDGTARTVTLATRTLEPMLGARTVPALDGMAYLEASFPADDDLPVLPGEVTLARDGTFVGRGRLPFVPPGEKVRLGFGVDDRIKVTRVPVSRKDNDNNFFGTSRGETQDFRTTVKNGHAFPIRIALVDRLPVSENTAVTVAPLGTNTAATEKAVDDKRGVLGWTFDYKPGETRDVRFGWTLRWPSDRE